MNSIFHIALIIPCVNLDTFLIECIEQCLNLHYNDYEIVLVPDKELVLPFSSEKISQIPTGKKNPAQKRNIAIAKLKHQTDLFAFIDSDAYPDNNWLANAVAYFDDNSIAAVGGPNITPPGDEKLRKITGYVYEQSVGFANGAVKHKISKTRFMEELPACNLIIRKEIFNELSFSDDFHAAEDNKLCGDIRNLGYKILLAKDVIVFHHRRKIFLPLIKQAYFYGYYRAKLMTESSFFPLKIFMPSLFFTYILILSGILLFHPNLYCLMPLFLYWFVLFISSLFHIKRPGKSLLTINYFIPVVII